MKIEIKEDKNILLQWKDWDKRRRNIFSNHMKIGIKEEKIYYSNGKIGIIL